MDNKTIVKEIIMLDKQIKEKKKRQEELKLIIQTQGINELENKNIKYIQYYTVDGSCDVTYKQKMEIDNIKILEEIFDDVIADKITKKEEVKYEIESKFKGALIAMYIGDYKKHNIEKILQDLGLDTDKIKLALKKLKGEYIADKKLLESLGVVDDELEEELDAIRENKNYELIDKYIDISSIDDALIDKIKRAISIEESVTLGLSYEK